MQEEEKPKAATNTTPPQASAKPEVAPAAKPAQAAASPVAAPAPTASPPLKKPMSPPKAVKTPKASIVQRKRKAEKEQESIGPVRESKRSRVPVTQYQAPNPELQQVMKQSLKRKASGEGEDAATASSDNQTIVFFKGEHMAVRNADGGFFLCVSMQNVYKKAPSVASKKVTIQWLSEAPEDNPDKDIYVPEYHDKTEFGTILTSVELVELPPAPAPASRAESPSAQGGAIRSKNSCRDGCKLTPRIHFETRVVPIKY